ncbi:ComF family protein [Granulicella arctica]|uniref:ComF family protein n=1 Tax=Granulicella arctica TaxID=940613 RepID=UPI0021DF4C5A|nr:ComF family protein [Granulicella arctica]
MESDRFAGQFAAADVLCTTCRFVPPSFERATAFGVYKDELRTLVHLLKYERVRAAAKPLGKMLARAIDMLELTGDVAMIAVPLYPTKERQRGYNQAMLLADAAARLTGRTNVRLRAAHGLLRRVRDTESQFALSSKGRRTNLRGAFAVPDASAISGRTVLLIDDIYTTGATARECARVLVRAGAAKVFVATLARAQTERVERWDAGFETAKLEVSGNGLAQTGRIAT